MSAFAPAAVPVNRNFTGNAQFDVWQRGATFTLASGVKTKVADLWHAFRNSTGGAVSRQAGFSGAPYCMRIAKASGSGSGSISAYHQYESAIAQQFAGKIATLSFDARVGANYTGIGLSAVLHTGVGVDETLTASSNTFVSTTTATAFVTALIPTTTAQRYSYSAVVPADCTEAALRFGALQAAVAAGASDYVEITNIKLELGPVATRYEPEPIAVVMERCQRRFQKSFLYATAPAQNVGAGTGEHIGRAQQAAATSQRLPRVQLATSMRVAPAVTLFNPAAANAHVRDLTAGADCSASTAPAGEITENGFGITCTGNASTTAHANDLGVHWTADAEFA